MSGVDNVYPEPRLRTDTRITTRYTTRTSAAYVGHLQALDALLARSVETFTRQTFAVSRQREVANVTMDAASSRSRACTACGTCLAAGGPTCGGVLHAELAYVALDALASHAK